MTPAFFDASLYLFIRVRKAAGLLFYGQQESSIHARMIWIALTRSTPGGRTGNEEKLRFSRAE